MDKKKKKIVGKRHLNRKITHAVQDFFSHHDIQDTANLPVQQSTTFVTGIDQPSCSSLQNTSFDFQQASGSKAVPNIDQASGLNVVLNTDQTACATFDHAHASGINVQSNNLERDVASPSSSLFTGNDLSAWFENSSDSEVDLTEDNNDPTLREKLRTWSVQNNVTITGLSRLLAVLHPDHPELPLDGRTLLETPRTTEVKKLTNGEYSHVGILSGILSQITSAHSHELSFESSVIRIDVNVDGISVFKSSALDCWPILGRLVGVSQQNMRPFLIGVFCGNGKPEPIEVYLEDFIKEVKELREHGIKIKEKRYSFDVRFFLCDAPARAFLKKIVNHNGKEGCERCVQEGVYLNNCMTFVKHEATLRTNESFIAKANLNHHKGSSPLESLNIGFITQFPLDPMHLVYLGVVRRLIFCWLGIVKRSPCRLRANNIRTLSNHLIDLGEDIVCEFSRKCRGLKEVKKWKATEFRLFILYIGPVVLINKLPVAVYNHFMLLHCATMILVSETMCNSLLPYARKLLETFVTTARRMYGSTALVYNVHNLLHICDDVAQYGSFENFSCFPFENALGGIKKMIRSPKNPLQQIMRRTSEFEAAGVAPRQPNTRNEIILKQTHNKGPFFLGQENAQQFKKMCFENFELNIKPPNNCCKLKNGQILVILNIYSHSKEDVRILGQAFNDKEDFYTYPCKSSNLGVYLVKNLGSTKVYSASMILGKCLLLSLSNQRKVAMPLLHLPQ